MFIYAELRKVQALTEEKKLYITERFTIHGEK